MTLTPTLTVRHDLHYIDGTIIPAGTRVQLMAVIDVRAEDGAAQRLSVRWRGSLWQVGREDVE